MDTKTCFYQLLTLHEPGGESTVKSDLTPSGKVSIRLTFGDDFNRVGKLEGQVLGVDLDSDDVFGPNCFSPNCFVGGGIWTTAVRTDVSKVENGVTYYWLPGSLDPDGNLWFVEVGSVCPATGHFDLRESVAIQFEGRFYSVNEVGTGLKVAVLKRATATTVECVQTYIGEYPIPDRLTRSKTGYCLEYSAKDQETDIEAIALSVLRLLHVKYKHREQGQTLYYFNDEVDRNLVRVVEDNFNRLSRLVDTLSVTKRLGSIPKWVATYSEPDQIYGELADERYNNPIVRVFSENCFTEYCFEVGEDRLLVSREVRTRAIAWLAYALATHSVAWRTDKYRAFLDQLSTHLLNQVDPYFQLPIEGWTHTLTLSDSQPIREFKLSTAVSVVLAFLKLYELTEQEVYLEKGVDVYEAILDRLYSYKTQQFVQSLEDPKVTSESTVYGLLLSVALQRADLTENTLKLINARLRQDYNQPVEFFTSSTEYSSINPLSLEQLLLHPHYLSLLVDDGATQIQDISSYNLLLTELVEVAKGERFDLPQRLPLLSSVFEVAARQEAINSLQLTTSCLSGTSLLAEEQTANLPVKEVESLIFQRSFVYDKVRQMWPLHYSWVSEKALSPQGNLGKLLKSLSKSLSTWFVTSNRLLRGTFLNQSQDVSLERWGKDVGIEREKLESDSAYKERLTNHFHKPAALTADVIIQALARIGAKVGIHEPWKKIQGLNTFMRNPFSAILGESYYSGESYATTNLYELKVFRPIVDRITNIVRAKTAAGVKVIYSEVLAFEEDFDLQNGSCTKLTYTTIPETCYLLQENGDLLLYEGGAITTCRETCYLLQQTGDLILLEDGGALTTCSSCYLLQENEHKLQLESGDYLITCP